MTEDISHRGVELARSWIVWAEGLDEVVATDLGRFELVVVSPYGDPTPVTMVTDPEVMAKSFGLLAERGLDFWPRTTPTEAAWRMLSVDLLSYLPGREDDVTAVELSEGRTGPTIVPITS